MNEPIEGEWQSGQRSVTCYEREIAELKQQRDDLLDTCRMMLRLMEGENLDEKFDGEAEVLRDVINRAQQADRPERMG